jgi:hypothetical protein
LRTASDQGRGGMQPQGFAQPAGVEGPVRIIRMMHRPLELDAVPPRWTVLETDHRDVPLRLGPGADRSRRRRTTGRGHVSEPSSGLKAGQPTGNLPVGDALAANRLMPAMFRSATDKFRPDPDGPSSAQSEIGLWPGLVRVWG